MKLSNGNERFFNMGTLFHDSGFNTHEKAPGTGLNMLLECL